MTPDPSSDDERIGVLVARCAAIADPALRDDMVELLQRVLELHRLALERMLSAAPAAWGAIPEVAGLLELHGLTPPPLFPILLGDNYAAAPSARK